MLFRNLFFLILILNSCTIKKDVEKIFVPYSQIYQFDSPKDTLLSDGTFFQNLVNQDTIDKNLYLRYGNSFLKVFIQSQAVY